ncbi:MAG: D-aminoacylase [Hyphomonadaceae bacterium]|nr:D-aminoacylase [Hyphomonadaceae bacterium]
MHDLVIRGGLVVDGTGAESFVADVAIDDGVVTRVGDVSAKGREEIEAAGKIVTPGFVDVHTHYDGQATWDDEMAPSSWHGVTTVVMGNCGVGFAPAKPDRQEWLIGLMEGVEDIPGTALAEGMSWNWETFPEYLDELESMPRTIDVATHVPHGAVRAYVLGDREKPGVVPTEDDIQAMADIVEDGLRAGALGFSTSRTSFHRSIDGELVPGTTATKDELIGIGRAMGRVGYGVFEMASDLNREWDEFGWMGDLSRETGRPVTFSAVQELSKDHTLDEQITIMRSENEKGANIVAQIALRGTGMIMGWQGTIHPFVRHPSWMAMEDLSWDEQYAKLKDPAFKAQLLGETPELPEGDQLEVFTVITSAWGMQYEMDEEFNYEPQADESIAARAQAAGKSEAEHAYDVLMRDEGKGFIYLPLLNYSDGNLDFLIPLQNSDDTVNSLSDGGAHCGLICDAANTTFMLEHWVKKRKGGTITLENAVKRQCLDTARLYGLNDRGVLKPGYLADINVIDMDRIKLGKPWMAFDLPAGGKRLLQRADGYEYTIKSGQITFKDGVATDKRPGALIRGPQVAKSLEAAG